MKRKITLLASLFTALLATSAVHAGPFLFFDQLFGSAVMESGDKDRRMAKRRMSAKRQVHRTEQSKDGTGDGRFAGIGGPHQVDGYGPHQLQRRGNWGWGGYPYY